MSGPTADAGAGALPTKGEWDAALMKECTRHENPTERGSSIAAACATDEPFKGDSGKGSK